MTENKPPTERLFHSFLSNVPVPIRFALSGLLGNVFFVVVYNACLSKFQMIVGASTIYAVVQFSCIIVNHALNCGLVFGWPRFYYKSLAANMPVGISALLLGAISIQVLDRIQFDNMVESMLGVENNDFESNVDEDEEKKGFYSSLVVMTITGLYSYVLLSIVNKPSTTSDLEKEEEAKKKKEL